MNRKLITVLTFGYMFAPKSDHDDRGGEGGQRIAQNEEASSHLGNAARELRSFATEESQRQDGRTSSTTAVATAVSQAKDELNSLKKQWDEGRLTPDQTCKATAEIDRYLASAQGAIEENPAVFTDNQVKAVENAVKEIGLAIQEMPGIKVPSNSQSPSLIVEFAPEFQPYINGARIHSSLTGMRSGFLTLRSYWSVVVLNAKPTTAKVAVRKDALELQHQYA
jgi:hypothetical protein